MSLIFSALLLLAMIAQDVSKGPLGWWDMGGAVLLGMHAAVALGRALGYERRRHD